MPLLTTITPPTPSHRHTVDAEEWPDADFDLPEGAALHTPDLESDKEGDEDWDLEMDLGKTAGAKARAVLDEMAARSETSKRPQMITIRPPLPNADVGEGDEDEGISTIKVSELPKPHAPSSLSVDDDMESAFALPEDMTQLSLRPASLHHRSSKSSFEWTDKDHTSSSQSSDAFTSLGFADTPPSSNYTSASSASLPETESEEEEEEGVLDGLVIPSGLFDSGHGVKHLTKVLEMKKKLPAIAERIKVASPDPEDDFEVGLVIDDEAKFSPSRLLHNKQQSRMRLAQARSKSAPSRPPLALRPPSRLRQDRAKSPTNPPPSSVRQLRQLAASPTTFTPSGPSRPAQPTRAQTFQALASAPPAPSASFLSPKPGSLRGQKSHSGLKPPSPPSQRKLIRKASLSSLTDNRQAQVPGSGVPSGSTALPRYETHTAASRAKTHSSTSRMTGLDYTVPPTRPTTPSANPVAIRLTLPTSSTRLKSRPAISSVFPNASGSSSGARPASPVVRRPSSTLANRPALVQSPPPSSAAKMLRKPKRARTYGDGTELDAIDDLPTDRDKEAKFRVKPTGYGNRVPGGSYSTRTFDEDAHKGTMRRKAPRESDSSTGEPTLRKTGGIEFPAKSGSSEAIRKKKKKHQSPANATPRKPTLIRNLGGSNAPKVVGDMKWNPQTLRWEGNDQALRDFDAAVGTSTRPALITHLTGSSVGSPVGSLASGARIVGNMFFDPDRMCWISTLPPEEEEPDVFADLADDEEDGDGWETKGGTIRANQHHQTGGSATATPDRSATSSASSSHEPPSPARSHTRTISESGSDRGSRASMVYDVDDDFADKCHVAEDRHRTEVHGWRLRPKVEPEPRTWLYEIRALATRKY
ncbi:hypothetical protein PUNSTDRAFT_95668 [Punctularia strigosozonata HHB-11173 SS5]|uniref:uncharacterized protein n=1 Tax=Punctularia strigosozonata (strain HHB-11173) TaxID=741275 RepID=UPI0004416E19|nr:uncharacterized protein PUNSTDRAFT_95668 [Punctularia strigosozonata HHB-11173 SS5]EIN14099.1 hypothetical protein PUNSTDRAFT_95668 [Punctularia strigosozonata HHB-11173 SS5]